MAIADVIHVRAQEVAEAFAVGRALICEAGFQVHASRREGPGQAESHAAHIDIFHMQHGAAELVTGGSIVNRQDVGPGEMRGSHIDGGCARTLRPGDVIVIPAGVPHWFKDVEPGTRYFTVKVGP